MLINKITKIYESARIFAEKMSDENIIKVLSQMVVKRFGKEEIMKQLKIADNINYEELEESIKQRCILEDVTKEHVLKEYGIFIDPSTDYKFDLIKNKQDLFKVIQNICKPQPLQPTAYARLSCLCC